MEQALRDAAPAEALLRVARQLRDEGMAQAELYALFDFYRERHASDPDDTLYDAVIGTMDLIVGWCSPSNALYPDRGPSA